MASIPKAFTVPTLPTIPNTPVPSKSNQKKKKKKKRVTFNLEINQSVDNLEFDTTISHRPDAQPASGILKTSPLSNTEKKTQKNKAADWF